MGFLQMPGWPPVMESVLRHGQPSVHGHPSFLGFSFTFYRQRTFTSLGIAQMGKFYLTVNSHVSGDSRYFLTPPLPHFLSGKEVRALKIGWLGRAAPAKSGDQSLTPRTHMVERTLTCKLPSDLHMHNVACTCTPHTHIK